MERSWARCSLLPGSVPTTRKDVAFVTVDVTNPLFARISEPRSGREIEFNLPVITKRFPAIAEEASGPEYSRDWLSNTPTGLEQIV